MDTIDVQHPDWSLTFPHRATPLQDEWLPSLLLRCDEANSWGSGTSVRYLLRTSQRASSIQEFNPLRPSAVFLKHVAETLALPIHLVEKTTYQLELARLSHVLHPQLDRVHTWHRLALCPKCLAQQQILRRSLMLLHITCCPEHSLALQSQCRCYQFLFLFSKGGKPFTCLKCGLNWSKLPQIDAPSWEVVRSQRFFSYYEFFFSNGTPQVFSAAWHLIGKRRLERERSYGPGSYRKHSLKKRIQLGGMISLLYELGISIKEIMNYTNENASEERVLSDLAVSE